MTVGVYWVALWRLCELFRVIIMIAHNFFYFKPMRAFSESVPDSRGVLGRLMEDVRII